MTHIETDDRMARRVHVNAVDLKTQKNPQSRKGFRGLFFRIQDSGFRNQDSGFRNQDSGFRNQDSGFKNQDSGWGA